MRVVFLTEGGRERGLGHITRCISLYQAFEEKGIIPEFIVSGDGAAADVPKGKNFSAIDWLAGDSRLASCLHGADIAIVDSYLANIDHYAFISAQAGLPVYMDDNKRLDYPRGVVVNGGVNAECLEYPLTEGVTYLLGPKYIPLRKAFRSAHEKEIKRDVESIMVTFGGEDIRGLTREALRLLQSHYPHAEKNVIVGREFKDIDGIENASDSRTNLFFQLDADAMMKVMLESDIAISAGGQTLYELARTGVPTVAVIAADNQLNNVRGFEQKGIALSAGWWHEGNIMDSIVAGIHDLRGQSERMRRSSAGEKLVDGLGAERIVRYCIKKLIAGNIILRPANTGDMSAVYELSNEQEVRRNSFNRSAISLDEHREWFAGKLKDMNCLFLVAEAGDNFVGQVRFEIAGDEATVSISIGEVYRGAGIGALVLEEARVSLQKSRPGLKTLKAYVKEDNPSSSKLFERAGFTFVKKETVREQQALLYMFTL